MANEGQWALCILAGAGVIGLFYAINKQSQDSIPVPSIQTEAQVMGLGLQAGMRVNAGTPLDTSYHIHGWHPGYDPDPSAQPVVQSKVRYPAIPGGNLSTVIHNGWSQMCKKAPADWEWQLNPPEAAIL